MELHGITWNIPLRMPKDVLKYSNNFDVCIEEEFYYLKTIISCTEDKVFDVYSKTAIMRVYA